MRLLAALLLIGVAVYFVTQRAPAPLQRSTGESAQVPATTEVRDGFSTDRGLDSAELKRRARAAADRLDDARVIASIKAKFALDKDLAAGAIGVRCDNGLVSLSGEVPSRELATRAIELAETTEGVANVRSDLRVAGASRD